MTGADKQKFFTKFYGIRIHPEQMKIVKNLYQKNKDLFNSESDVVRCAINSFVRTFVRKKNEVV